MAKTKQTEFDVGTAKPVRVPKALRAVIEAALEKHIAATESLTALLDRIDGDENLEDGNDDEPSGDENEPTLSHTNAGSASGASYLDGDGEDEPELGWTEGVNQMRNKSNESWLNGEPSLGSRDGMINQAIWSSPGDTGDREEQCDDEGSDTDTEFDHAELENDPSEADTPGYITGGGSDGDRT